MNRRALNFSFNETETLIFNLEVRPELISTKYANSSPTYEEQASAWDQIALMVSAAGVQRTAYDVRRKWADMKSRVKLKAAKIAEYKEIHGEDLPSTLILSCLEERILALIRSVCPPSDAINLGENSSPILEKRYVVGMPPVTVEQDIRERNVSLQNDRVTDFNLKPQETPSQSNNSVIKSLPQKNAEIHVLNGVRDSNERGAVCKKRKLRKSSDDILKNILQTQKKLRDSHVQQLEEIRKMKEVLNRLVKLKEAKLKLKCIEHGLNYKSVTDKVL